jgi:hypothetical protein
MVLESGGLVAYIGVLLVKVFGELIWRLHSLQKLHFYQPLAAQSLGFSKIYLRLKHVTL